MSSLLVDEVQPLLLHLIFLLILNPAIIVLCLLLDSGGRIGVGVLGNGEVLGVVLVDILCIRSREHAAGVIFLVAHLILCVLLSTSIFTVLKAFGLEQSGCASHVIILELSSQSRFVTLVVGVVEGSHFMRRVVGTIWDPTVAQPVIDIVIESCLATTALFQVEGTLKLQGFNILLFMP